MSGERHLLIVRYLPSSALSFNVSLAVTAKYCVSKFIKYKENYI